MTNKELNYYLNKLAQQTVYYLRIITKLIDIGYSNIPTKYLISPNDPNLKMEIGQINLNNNISPLFVQITCDWKNYNLDFSLVCNNKTYRYRTNVSHDSQFLYDNLQNKIPKIVAFVKTVALKSKTSIIYINLDYLQFYQPKIIAYLHSASMSKQKQTSYQYYQQKKLERRLQLNFKLHKPAKLLLHFAPFNKLPNSIIDCVKQYHKQQYLKAIKLQQLKQTKINNLTNCLKQIANQRQTNLQHKQLALVKLSNLIEQVKTKKQIKLQLQKPILIKLINDLKWIPTWQNKRKLALNKLNNTLQSFKAKRTKQNWLKQQKQRLKPFPQDMLNSALNFDNHNLITKDKPHKLIYFLLGLDKQNQFIIKIGRTNHLEAREYLYKITTSAKNNYFKANQTILLVNYFVDLNNAWTKDQFYALESLFIHQLRRHNLRQYPREWFYGKNKKQRRKILHEFIKIKYTIIHHPKLLNYFNKRSKYAVNDCRNHDLNWLLQKAQQ